MATETLLMCAINVTLLVIMLPRIYGDWMSFTCLCREEQHEELKNLLHVVNQWITRHMVCAFAAFSMIVVIKHYQHVDRYDQLSKVIVVYAMLCLMFAFAESLFAQKISKVAVSDD